MKHYIIGIDIGGTNTDAVLLDEKNKIIASNKTVTSQNITDGFAIALQTLLTQAKINVATIAHVLVGTTHATNALLQHKDLYKVGLIRIAGYPIDALPPCYAWPHITREAILAGFATIDGGFECDGRPMKLINEQQAEHAIRQLLKQGAESFALIGVFSPLTPDNEEQIASIITKIAGPSMPISRSHNIGGIGFIERENATILNAALKKSLRTGFEQLRTALDNLGIDASLELTQNNGTRLSLEAAMEFPVLTISAGPTNSFIGASQLAHLDHTLVVDIGGTSTDIGFIKHGFPRRSTNSATIGGIMLNFAMPDVLSLALGGGTHISYSQHEIIIGPHSVGRQIMQKAQCFGGNQLTFTDVALLHGTISIAGADVTKICIKKLDAQHIMQQAINLLADRIRLMAGPDITIPIVFVGGGAQLIDFAMLQELLPHNRLVVPDHAGVANAFGAALAQISGIIDCTVSLTQRASTLVNLRNQAIQKAIDAGAHTSTITIVDEQIIPYNYVPGNLARVIITAAGKRIE